MEPVDIFLSIVSELAIIMGAIFLALWFQPGQTTNQLTLGLLMVLGGAIAKICINK